MGMGIMGSLCSFGLFRWDRFGRFRSLNGDPSSSQRGGGFGGFEVDRVAVAHHAQDVGLRQIQIIVQCLVIVDSANLFLDRMDFFHFNDSVPGLCTWSQFSFH